jgi:hypothetical protein
LSLPPTLAPTPPAPPPPRFEKLGVVVVDFISHGWQSSEMQIRRNWRFRPRVKVEPEHRQTWGANVAKVLATFAPLHGDLKLVHCSLRINVTAPFSRMHFIANYFWKIFANIVSCP